MRKHGWQLPYHPLQIAAGATFLALVFAFYIFFLPFVECGILRVLLCAAYSPMASVVSVLYIWCVATDPVDAHVQSLKHHDLSLPSFKKKNSVSSHTINTEKHALSSCICMEKSNEEISIPEDDILYCNLCKAEIFKHSKHCRVCDKCVDGFDHHCRWLNNCIGRKNYKGFVCLILSGFFTFVLQGFFGLWIIVHRILNGRHFETIIALKLGRSFSSIVYLLVMVLCTMIAMVATYFLGQLFFFHVLLIKKGITTYDYIIAVRREHDLKFKVDKDIPNSRIADRDNKSLTVEPESRIVGSLHAQSNEVREEASLTTLPGGRMASVKRKLSVKIDPWALAFLSKHDIIQAATMARRRSSISQPVNRQQSKVTSARAVDAESNFDSFGSISTDLIASLGISHSATASNSANFIGPSISSAAWQKGKLPMDVDEQLDSSENDSDNLSHRTESEKMMSPLQREARNVFRSSQAFCASGDQLDKQTGSRPSGSNIRDIV